jgi:hypothetical protein
MDSSLKGSVLRQAAAQQVKPQPGPLHAHATRRVEASNNPLQDVLDFQDDAMDAIKDLKSDAPEAAKYLEQVIKHCKAMDPYLSRANSEWRDAIAAFKKFQGEVGDKELESKFKTAVKSMFVSMGFGGSPRL